MEKTRKAFVVLAAAVTAGNYIGCGSNNPEEQDAQLADAASQADAQGADVVKTDTQSDTQGGDAAVLADAQGPDAAPPMDTQGPDAAPPMDTQAIDATPRTDVQVVADLRQESVIVNEDASVPSPDTRLVMPAGTLYDVLVRNDVA